ncbi:MAG: hypothetical protein OXB88_09875 [Bacteriovoracales bacterium]|nr:hypothetical protein [Bacteriovoracales bacterium]
MGQKRIFFSILVFLLVLGGRELWKINNQIVRPKEMPESKFLVLRKTAEIPLQDKIEFQFAFDPRFNRLWVSSNLNQKVDILLKLEALKGKVLSLEPIEFQGAGQIKRHFARFDHFSFTRGSQIYSGFYRVHLSYRMGKQERGHSDVIYLGEGGEEAFAKKLKIYKESVHKAFENYSFELSERYATLGSLLRKTETLFKKRLKIKGGKSGKWGGDFFEKNYSKEIGPLLTQFASDNFLNVGKVPFNFGAVQTQFNILFDLSKSLAGLSEEILRTFRGGVSRVRKNDLKGPFLKKFHTLKENVLLHEKRAKSLKPPP